MKSEKYVVRESELRFAQNAEKNPYPSHYPEPDVAVDVNKVSCNCCSRVGGHNKVLE